MNAERLDSWLPQPSVRTRHRSAGFSDAGILWRAALDVRLTDTYVLGRLIRWRIPGTRAEQSFAELFSSYPFTVLEQEDGLLLAGLCGRIWTLTRDYPALDGAHDFRDWAEPGTVRVLFAHWVEPAREGGFALVSEARVQPVDSGAARRLRALWRVVGPFERLVGSEALNATVAAAEDLRDSQADGRPRAPRTVTENR